MQTNISILMLALYNNRPMIFTLREVLEHFILHRREIITKRTEFDLAKHEARAHICDGLIIALNNIDKVVELIKKADSAEIAAEQLQKQLKFSQPQATAILEMRLQRLTGLEQTKLHDELKTHRTIIEQLRLILSDATVLNKEIAKEFEMVKNTYGDKRLTKIEQALDGFEEKDLIPDEEVVVTLTHKGYIKRVPIDTYTVQHRGGRGKKGMADLNDSDDIMQDAFVARNHDELLFFTNFGRVYSLEVYQIPEGSRTAKGRAVINLIPLTENERVVKLLCLHETTDKFLVMITKKGTIKKTDLSAFAKIRSTGIRAIGLQEQDELAFCDVSNGESSIVIATSRGQGIHFKETEIRSMGRQASGVRGIRLRPGDFVVGMEIIADLTRDILFATSRGYGKRVQVADFRLAHRGGLGVRTIPVDKRNGEVIGLTLVSDESHVLLIDVNGKIIRLSPQEIRIMRRHAKGVRLIRLDETQALARVVAFEEEDKADGENIPTSPETSLIAQGKIEEMEGEVEDITKLPADNEAPEDLPEETKAKPEATPEEAKPPKKKAKAKTEEMQGDLLQGLSQPEKPKRKPKRAKLHTLKMRYIVPHL
jgi:Type IIA topoisomerase (DNA gyrase/topo II, topoisomerase IV), A subunit